MSVLKIAIIALLAIEVSCFDEEVQEMAKMVRDSCVGETNADVSLIEKISAGAPLTPDPVLKCYIKCTMETIGMMSDGEMDLNVVMSLLPEDLKNKHGAGLQACGTKKGADDCDTAYLTQVCWQNAAKEDYFLV